MNTFDHHRRFARVGERDGLGLAVTGILPGNEKLDSDGRLSVSEVLAARKRSHVSQAFKSIMRPCQSLGIHKYVHVHRRSIIPVRNQSHATNDRIWNTQ